MNAAEARELTIKYQELKNVFEEIKKKAMTGENNIKLTMSESVREELRRLKYGVQDFNESPSKYVHSFITW